MSFTVARHGGTIDDDFHHYVRLLGEHGVEIDRLTRVPEPGTRSRWLHVWATREAAEEFRKELVKDSRDKNWYVHELNPEEQKQVTEGPLGPITINVGIQRDGWVFGLHPQSRRLIRMQYPDAALLRSIFVSFEQDNHGNPLGQPQDTHFAQIATMLTGLGKTELERLGGYRIFSTQRESEVFRHTPILSGR